MRKLLLLAVLASSAAANWVEAPFAQAATPAASELLAAADRARGATERGITWEVAVKTTEDGEVSAQDYLVRVRGNNAYIETTAPARNKGEVLLINDRAIWYFKPGLRRPISVSARQHLSGQAVNGDIASTNYARNYEGTVVGEEVINGEPAYKLELKAKSLEVTYDSIRYWVSKTRQLALKADFLTLDGKVFKTATFVYGNHLVVDGKNVDLVSEVTITDPAFASNKTVITYSGARYEDHPERLFDVSNLVH